MKLYLTPDLEIKANEVQGQHSNILVDPIMEDLEMYLEREIPIQYASWTIPNRLAYQKGAYPDSNFKMTTLNMVCARQIIEELPNDIVRRNPSKYTSQYINRLMSMILIGNGVIRKRSRGCTLHIATRQDGQSILG